MKILSIGRHFTFLNTNQLGNQFNLRSFSIIKPSDIFAFYYGTVYYAIQGHSLF